MSDRTRAYSATPYSAFAAWNVREWRLEPYGKRCLLHEVVPPLGFDCGNVSFTAGAKCGCEGFVFKPRPQEEIDQIEVMTRTLREEAILAEAEVIKAERG